MSEGGNLDFVLDAWALLAHFGNEAGAERVRQVLKSAERHECTTGMSMINLGEVAYLLERERGLEQVHKVLAVIRSLPIRLLTVDEKVVLAAAHIKANHRLSYADAFAAASAKMWQAKLLTGDPELKALEGSGFTIELLSG